MSDLEKQLSVARAAAISALDEHARSVHISKKKSGRKGRAYHSKKSSWLSRTFVFPVGKSQGSDLNEDVKGAIAEYAMALNKVSSPLHLPLVDSDENLSLQLEALGIIAQQRTASIDETSAEVNAACRRIKEAINQ